MRELFQAVPDIEALLALSDTQLGLLMLRLLKDGENGGRPFSRHNTILQVGDTSIERSGVPYYPSSRLYDVQIAVTEAFLWLEKEILIIPKPGDNSGWFVISRKGRSTNDYGDLWAISLSTLLPPDLLHPVLRESIRQMFVAGQFDVAVFHAMKQVEVSIRIAAKLEDGVVGTELARRAFHVENGALTDRSKPLAEREALAHLVAGAIGSYKNPHSHRNVELNDPVEAAEIIFLANHLLRIIESRAS